MVLKANYEYNEVLETIIRKVQAAQTRAMVAVNRELIEIYRDIGRMIHEQQEKAHWGESVVEQLAQDLQKYFPGTKRFSSRNLWIMKDFYTSYCNNEKLQTLSAEIN
jgi:predicted nuclease of restriction endonuclease-like (RecB) superfamily